MGFKRVNSDKRRRSERMKKKVIAALMVAAMAVGLLAGCGGASDDKNY